MSTPMELTPLGLASKAFSHAEQDIEDALASCNRIPDYEDLSVRPDGASYGGELVIDFGNETEAPDAVVLAALLAGVIAKHGIGTVTVHRAIVDSFEVPEVA